MCCRRFSRWRSTAHPYAHGRTCLAPSQVIRPQRIRTAVYGPPPHRYGASNGRVSSGAGLHKVSLHGGEGSRQRSAGETDGRLPTAEHHSARLRCDHDTSGTGVGGPRQSDTGTSTSACGNLRHRSVPQASAPLTEWVNLGLALEALERPKALEWMAAGNLKGGSVTLRSVGPTLPRDESKRVRAIVGICCSGWAVGREDARAPAKPCCAVLQRRDGLGWMAPGHPTEAGRCP